MESRRTRVARQIMSADQPKGKSWGDDPDFTNFLERHGMTYAQFQKLDGNQQVGVVYAYEDIKAEPEAIPGYIHQVVKQFPGVGFRVLADYKYLVFQKPSRRGELFHDPGKGSFDAALAVEKDLVARGFKVEVQPGLNAPTWHEEDAVILVEPGKMEVPGPEDYEE